jgi:hypothetical protein
MIAWAQVEGCTAPAAETDSSDGSSSSGSESDSNSDDYA